MRKYLLLSFLTFISCGMLMAQRNITGKVVDGDDSNNGGLPGASVIVQGTNVGTVTDINGNYSISVPEGGVLVFSFVGYATQEIIVGARASVDVILKLDVEQLAEVIVIGYGETTIKDATGAVAAVSSKDFNGGVIASPEQLIQGKTAGVRITAGSGEPGSSVSFNIRGSNSITASNNPLFVVDGVPLDGGNTSGGGGNVGFGTSGSRNPLNFINPNDIESISILKDASATAIYGSRGANGVVIISTKSGRGNELKIDYSSLGSVSFVSNRYDLLDRQGFLDGVTQIGGNASDVDFGNDIDWQDQIFRAAFSHSQNVAISKGYDKGSFRASFGYDDQQGVIEESGLERITARLNANRKFLNDKLKLDLQLTGSRVNDEFAPLSGSAGFRGDLLGAAYSANPTWDLETDPNQIGGQLHPLNILRNHQATSNTNRLLLNISATYELTENLNLKLTYGLDKSESETVSIATADALNFDRGTTGNGRAAFGERVITNDLFEATLNYKKAIGNSNLEAVVGYSFQDFGSRGIDAEGFGFQDSNFENIENNLIRSLELLEGAAADNTEGLVQQFGFASEITNGGDLNSGAFANLLFPGALGGIQSSGGVAIPTPAGLSVQSIAAGIFDQRDVLQSFFGRVNYSIAGKYLFTGTVRADGSSRFGEDNRYGIFPSGAFAWQLGEEDFIGDAFSTLKLRIGAGITGNQDGLGFGQPIGTARFTDINIGDNGAVAIPGAPPASTRSPKLQWESTSQLTFGIDFGFNNDRFYGSFDLYRKITDKLLLNLISAQPSSNDFVFRNFDGDNINQGIELALNYDIIRKSDVKLTASFNISYNDNELRNAILLVPAGTIRGQGLTGAFAQQLQAGQPLFSFFLRPFEGFDSEGQPIQEDIQQFVGASALPTVNSGLSLNLEYKNWSFATYFAGQFGHSVYNNTANAFFTAGSLNSSRNVTRDVVNNGEAGSAAAEVSTRFLEDGDFVRLQNLSIGYNVPLEDGTVFKNLNFNINAQNLFVITGYSGLDPEVSVQPASTDLLNGLPIAGIDYTAYPRARTFSLGVSASF